MDRVSHRSLVKFAVDARWHNDRSDFRDRAWRPTLPVLHMAVALYTAFGERASSGLLTDHADFFFDPAIAGRAVALAEPLEAVVRDLWGSQFDTENQWRFRLIA